MEIVNTPNKITNNKGIVLTLGFFDGVHRGHRKLINTAIDKAKELQMESAVMTFWPHPRIVLGKDPQNLFFLTTLPEKAELIAKLGIRYFLVQEFTLALAAMEADAFVKQVVETYNVKHFVVGKNHRFGKQAKGDFALLQQLGPELGYTIDAFETVSDNSQRISSTNIRAALMAGNLQAANQMLSYPYLLAGTIETGRKLGRTIGFPTANIKPNDPLKLVPANGVYAVLLHIDGKVERGMMNIGVRPTVDSSHRRTIEVHIIDFNADVYNHHIEVAFVERLRNEQKFASVEELKAQLHTDKQTAIEVLDSHNLNDFKKYFLTLSV
jgi:riboflavin kinase/FMN adenylyltransferase